MYATDRSSWRFFSACSAAAFSASAASLASLARAPSDLTNPAQESLSQHEFKSSRPSPSAQPLGVHAVPPPDALRPNTECHEDHVEAGAKRSSGDPTQSKARLQTAFQLLLFFATTLFSFLLTLLANRLLASDEAIKTSRYPN